MRGFARPAILLREVFPNALIPTVALGGVQITLLLGGTTHTLHYQETVCHTGAWARRDASETPLVLTSVVPSHPIERFVQGRRTALR